MKQILENFKTGECVVEDVPAPAVQDNFVLVRNHYSLISTGTEGGTVNFGKMNLLGKAMARPEQMMKVIHVAKTQGLMVAYNAAMRSLEMPISLGYSSAGEVIDVGKGVENLKIGDRVACGGAGFANHAEIVCVPKNLCVHVPDTVELRHAAFTTLGSIAMQSLRVADVRIGENIVVIGLGLVGLLTVQLLQAAGCRVFGVDINPARVKFVKDNQYCDAELADAENINERVSSFTNGKGTDAVIITAATESNTPVIQAGQFSRRKGRVVVVGRTKMEAPRETYLFKELELLTSMAYGPGTGDVAYEFHGIDYPYAYVRWTEGRNMQSFIDLINNGSVSLDKLVTHEFNIDDASTAFDLITGGKSQSTRGVLIKYPIDTKPPVTGESINLSPSRPINYLKGTVRISLIGAGSFATNEFLPLLAKHKDIVFRSIASSTGVKAKVLGKKYGFEVCTSDPQSIIADNQTDCVFILTRHDTHAQLTIDALRAGKHVFVEKPLALKLDDINSIGKAQRESGRLLMVGFNRRYAPLAIKMKEHFGNRAQPASIHYCANVGYRPPEHWLHDPKQGGGVILGEACHHIDFCNWFINKPVESVETHMLQGNNAGFISEDNVHILIRYADGSLANIVYLSNGSKSYAAERAEVFCDNKVAVLTDFRKLEVTQGLFLKTKRLWFGNKKGHEQQIRAFLSAVKGDGAAIDIPGYILSSHISILASEYLKGNNRHAG